MSACCEFGDCVNCVNNVFLHKVHGKKAVFRLNGQHCVATVML